MPHVQYTGSRRTTVGRELIEAITKRGDKAIATARNLSSIEDLKSDSVATLQLEVTASQDELNQRAEEAVKAFGRIDVLVHNAGYMQMGTWEDLTPELLQAQFATNFFGPVNLTRAILPHMRSRNAGTVVFVNSTSRLQHFAGVAAYGASKAALDRFVDGLTREVGPAGIKTLSLDIGAFQSSLILEHKAPSNVPPTEHHGQLMDALVGYLPLVHANPVIDITKLANLFVDLVKGEGVAEGREIPLRLPGGPDDLWKELANEQKDIPQTLPVGPDAFEYVKQLSEYGLRKIEMWEDVIKSANVETRAAQ
ncbi:uncharacterized protein LTR77_003644 [Saxophila tyrrhenica]|uniref:NAD(P)-binding protein n=1 Tax=Saxophila tyrrhenica TaxID=1690608 RepID=A0AAV9PIF4_9PEZI|nr:hypothetical protein LTR77_003644 [Saxophila tyrrhenica]